MPPMTDSPFSFPFPQMQQTHHGLPLGPLKLLGSSIVLLKGCRVKPRNLAATILMAISVQRGDTSCASVRPFY